GRRRGHDRLPDAEQPLVPVESVGPERRAGAGAGLPVPARRGQVLEGRRKGRRVGDLGGGPYPQRRRGRSGDGPRAGEDRDRLGLEVSTATGRVPAGADRVAPAPAVLARPARLDAPALRGMLRAACGLEFVGHGAFGLITKAAWVPYFTVVGIPEALAWRLMPVIGTVDIAIGLLVALRPI